MRIDQDADDLSVESSSPPWWWGFDNLWQFLRRWWESNHSNEGRARCSAGISVLPHSESTQITGGQFNAVGGNQIRVEVNVNGVGTRGPRRHIIRPTASDVTDLDTQGIQDIETTGSHTSSQEFPRNSGRGGSRAVQPFSGYTTYFRCLTTQERGSPLWIPSPNRQLPVEYQRNGLVIGDVGIITDKGCFDSLFNISLSLFDPLQVAFGMSDRLPQNFVPLEINRNDLFKFSQFEKGTSLSSGPVSVRRTGSGLIFTSSASEGAILTLPDRSNSEDLRNEKKLRDYLALHLEEFYRCALIEHGRVIKNGDLRIVTGFDKTTSWGMAAFLDSTSQTETSFRLEFQPRDQGSVGQTLNWTSSGTAEVKAGPDTREIDALRMGDPSQQNVEYENQSVFVRTVNPTLSSSIWKKLAKMADIPYLERDDNSDTPSGSHSRSSAPPGSGNTATGGRGGQSSASSSYFGSLNTLKIHPSNGINTMLLKLHPSARMAITGDNIWISVLKRDDMILPSVETLCKRIMQLYDVRLENGVVFLVKSRPEVPLERTLSVEEVMSEASSSTTLGKTPKKRPRVIPELHVFSSFPRLSRQLFTVPPGRDVSRIPSDPQPSPGIEVDRDIKAALAQMIVPYARGFVPHMPMPMISPAEPEIKFKGKGTSALARFTSKDNQPATEIPPNVDHPSGSFPPPEAYGRPNKPTQDEGYAPDVVGFVSPPDRP